MRTGDKTAVGIDISLDRISIVLLRSGKNGPELITSAAAPVPDGAVKDGNLADPVLLSRAIKDLRRHSGIRANRAAVTLFARPAVVQIMDMPQQAPTNIRQFVNNEIKNCVVLPGRDIAVDFSTVGSAKRTSDRRVLVVAAENEKMLGLVRVCEKAGFSVESIEPPLLAYLRAVYARKITGKTAFNVLVAILQGTSLTMCVLRNGAVDFIRTKEIEKVTDDFNRRLSDELSEVVRFYDVDVSENTGKWDVTVFIDAEQSPQIVGERIKSEIRAEHLQVRTIQNACEDTPVGDSAAEKNEKPSPVAVGLAMNLLKAYGTNMRGNPSNLCRINLLPPQIKHLRETKKDALIAANAVAAILLFMLLAINGFALLIERATRSSIAKQQLVENKDIAVLIEQQKLLDRRLGILTTRLDAIGRIEASHRDIDWAKLFEEIRRATPRSVRISAMSCQDGSKMLIQGLALSNEAVYSFLNLLEKSPGITSVTLLEAREQDWQTGLITYQLSCVLSNTTAKAENVG